MHPDVEPFRPFSTENALYRIISLFTLHALCIVLGLFGTWYVATRSRK
jgi:hypothetical protein